MSTTAERAARAAMAASLAIHYTPAQSPPPNTPPKFPHTLRVTSEAEVALNSSRRPALPKSFTALRTLAHFNTLTAALSLAALLTASIAHLGTKAYGEVPPLGALALTVGVPSFFATLLWATLMRDRLNAWRRAHETTNVRWPWVWSVFISSVTGGVATALTLPNREDFLSNFLRGATFGGVLWLPALLVGTLYLGVPLTRAQRLAIKGLSGEELGEGRVALVSASMSMLAVLIAAVPSRCVWRDAVFQSVQHFGRIVFALFWIGGASLGVVTAALATLRASRRKAFIASVEAGNVALFRVEPTPGGKVLIRIATSTTYRVAEFDQEVYELDDRGDAKKWVNEEPETPHRWCAVFSGPGEASGQSSTAATGSYGDPTRITCEVESFAHHSWSGQTTPRALGARSES